MHHLTDTEAIATWERADAPAPGGHAQPYRCTACDWTGRGETALRHYRETGHAIRGRDWPAGWPDCQWTAKPMVRVCAWCADGAARTADAVLAGREVTHGICETHAREFEARR